MASFTVERLKRGVDSIEFRRFKRVYEHALAVALEAEHRAVATAIGIGQRVDPAYPPLVELLAQCAPEEECPF